MKQSFINIISVSYPLACDGKYQNVDVKQLYVFVNNFLSLSLCFSLPPNTEIGLCWIVLVNLKTKVGLAFSLN
nr:hypothetical protein CFP56_22931 [Quercus suber]